MDIRINDKLIMKKPHPCGCSEFTVTRIGADLKIRCVGCGREIMAPREKLEKRVKEICRLDAVQSEE